MTAALYESSIKSLPLLARGKVRDMYAVGDDKLLIIATDRISAFDVILDDPIPGKGQVLKELTDFWLAKLAHVLPNHSTGIDPAEVVTLDEREQVRGRAVVVKRLRPIMVEAVFFLLFDLFNDFCCAHNGIIALILFQARDKFAPIVHRKMKTGKEPFQCGMRNAECGERPSSLPSSLRYDAATKEPFCRPCGTFTKRAPTTQP